MKNGGKREGAGAKEGDVRPKITSYWTQEGIIADKEHSMVEELGKVTNQE